MIIKPFYTLKSMMFLIFNKSRKNAFTKNVWTFFLSLPSSSFCLACETSLENSWLGWNIQSFCLQICKIDLQFFANFPFLVILNLEGTILDNEAFNTIGRTCSNLRYKRRYCSKPHNTWQWSFQHHRENML